MHSSRIPPKNSLVKVLTSQIAKRMSKTSGSGGCKRKRTAFAKCSTSESNCNAWCKLTSKRREPSHTALLTSFENGMESLH